MFTAQLSVVNVLCILIAAWTLLSVARILRRRAHTTQLVGPPSPNFFLGVSRYLGQAPDAAAVYEEWAKQYGPIFRIPATLGFTRVVLTDPKAILHFYSRETFGYVNTEMTKRAIEGIVGRGVLWAEGESHRRQRKALSPAFSNAAIRRLTHVFYDSAYKAQAAWDNIISSQSGDQAVIDVQNWMNHISLDTIGIAGFSHDFGTLHGKYSEVANTFDSFSNIKPSILNAITLGLGLVFPVLMKVPTNLRRLIWRLNANMGAISEELLQNTRKESLGESKTKEKSIIGLLIKAENNETEYGLHMTQDEVMAQMKVLILAGYETTSISLTWCLIELCKKTNIQDKLRQELLQFGSNDPTYDQFTNGLPYLDAVVHETLRLHPPLGETTRVAAVNDILPLSIPMKTASGAVVDRISIAKGEVVTVPIHYMNQAAIFWGPDAKEFIPERWLTEDGIPKRAQEIQGHRHLLSFIDGHRICLGRHFALAEFKAVLSVLIRNYAFELPGGPDTQIERVRGILPRPKISGEEGAKVPLSVRRLD